MSALRTPAPARGTGSRPARKGAVESTASWSRLDRIGLGLCWAAGIALCAICAAILLFMLFKGIQFLRPQLLVTHPLPDLDQSRTGGFLDPLIGTVVLTLLGIAFALPVGVATAVWLTEYGRPAGLARAVESGIEIVAGTPSIVLAIFGLIIFQQRALGFLSFTAQGGSVFGRSFLTAGTMMALLALPLVVGAMREALNSIPGHVREASYALGASKARTIRRVLLPGARGGIATGATLGMGRIAGDTAIVVILLGASLRMQHGDGPAGYSILSGTGSTLTTYVYNNSPAGEGNAPDKAYAAAFVLLAIVILLNFAVGAIGGRERRVAWGR
jgi:phosphate transport system permease protein